MFRQRDVHLAQGSAWALAALSHASDKPEEPQIYLPFDLRDADRDESWIQ